VVVAVSRTLFRSKVLSVGEFHCPAGDPRWREPNSIGDGHHLVFPGTPVSIAHEGRPAAVADQNVAVYYRPHERYRRGIVDPSGDHCVWVIPGTSLARALGLGEGERPAPFAGTGRRAFACQRLIAAALAGGGPVDALAVEEHMQAVVCDTLARARGRKWRPPQTACDEAVEGAREILARRYAERLSLGAIATEVHTSPFHLTRCFRVRTGRSLCEYRTQLRLRRAVELIADGVADDLARLAAELGFSSHSHFSDSFRRCFGVQPSALRLHGTADMRKILRAVSPA
jgi:AraC-like DNA-binding protein